jgi:hypothetical protein
MKLGWLRVWLTAEGERRNRIRVITKLKIIMVSLYEKLHGTFLKAEQHGQLTGPAVVNQSSIITAEEHAETNVADSSFVDTDQNLPVISEHSQHVHSSTPTLDSDSQTGYEEDVSHISCRNS